MLVFVILPLGYTVRLGFTNYSSRNLLTFERATDYLLEQTVAGPGQRFRFEAAPAAAGVRLVFTQAPADDEGEAAPAAERRRAPLRHPRARPGCARPRR